MIPRHRSRLITALLPLIFAVALTGTVTASPAIAAPAATSVGLSVASATSVLPNAKVTIGGRVNGTAKARRVIHLQLRTRRGWVTQVRTSSRANGTFSLRVPTFWYGAHAWRVQVGATSKARSSVSVARQVIVRRGYAAQGTPRAYRLMRGAPRWNPCQPIPYYLNLARAPRGAAAAVGGALRSISAASGLRFAYRGKTGMVPWRGYRATGLPSHGITIAWTTPSLVGALRGSTVGYGGSTYYKLRTGNVYKRGGVALDATARLSATRLKSLVMHEVGHAIGLGHVNVRGQVMYPMLADQTRFGAGDLAGLARIGLNQGCLPAS